MRVCVCVCSRAQSSQIGHSLSVSANAPARRLCVCAPLPPYSTTPIWHIITRVHLRSLGGTADNSSAHAHPFYYMSAATHQIRNAFAYRVPASPTPQPLTHALQIVQFVVLPLLCCLLLLFFAQQEDLCSRSTYITHRSHRHFVPRGSGWGGWGFVSSSVCGRCQKIYIE